MKKILSAVLAVACLAAIGTGCSKSGSGSKKASTTSEPISITFMWWGTQTRADLTQKVVKMYSESHKNVTISTVYQSYDDYYKKLAMMAAANNFPDVVLVDIKKADSAQFVSKNLIEPLNSYIKDKTIDTSGFSSNMLNYGKQNGKIYSLSVGTNALAMAVDPDVYQKAGLSVPTDGYATWDAMEKDLVKLKAVTGAYGADDMYRSMVFPYWCRQNGFEEYDATKGIGFDEKTFESFFTLKKKWIQEGLVPPLDESSQSNNVQLYKGKSAIYVLWTNNFESACKNSGKSLQLIPLPGPNAKKGMSIRSSQDMCISSKSSHKDVDASFLNYFINDIAANQVLNAERGMPAPTAVKEKLSQNFTPALKAEVSYLDQVEKNSSAASPAATAISAKVDTILQELEQEIIYNKMTPEQAFRSLQTQIKAAQDK